MTDYLAPWGIATRAAHWCVARRGSGRNPKVSRAPEIRSRPSGTAPPPGSPAGWPRQSAEHTSKPRIIVLAAAAKETGTGTSQPLRTTGAGRVPEKAEVTTAARQTAVERCATNKTGWSNPARPVPPAAHRECRGAALYTRPVLQTKARSRKTAAAYSILF